MNRSYLVISVVLLLVIIMTILGFIYTKQPVSYSSKSNWYLFGNKYCKEIFIKPENISYRFLCEGDKMIDIYDENGVPRGILYLNESNITQENAIKITSYFLDFLKNKEFGCELEKIEFYNQYEANVTYGWNLKRCEEPPWYAYFIRYKCNSFNISVTVSADNECDKVGRITSLFLISKDKVRDFAKLVDSCNCYYFEPSIFRCKKFKLFEDRIDFMECTSPVRTIIYTFKVSPETLIFVGGDGSYVQ